MSRRSTLFALLEAETEPTPKLYNETVDDVIRNPHQISGLRDDNVRDDVLILLTTHSHRLSHFFVRLRSVVRQMTKSTTASSIAAESVELLVDALPYIHQLLETTKVLDVLVPALDVCFAPSQRPALHKLASVLAKSGTLLEHLVSGNPGAEIIRQWASMQSTVSLDAKTLNLWTEKLMSMVNNCAMDHEVTQETQQWHMLKVLMDSLRRLEHGASNSSGTQHTPASRHDLPALGQMTQLHREDKKSRLVSHEDTNNTISALQDDDKRSLKAFGIHIPGSRSSLLEVIKRLEGEKTTVILLAIASKLPCYLCTYSLESPSQISKSQTYNESFQSLSPPSLEMLDKGIGEWKVLLSPQALRSLLHLGRHGNIASIIRNLEDIASGRWDPRDQSLAGSKQQRRCLKVPVAKTECGGNQFILWQIAIEVDEGTGLLQQEITVWEVCDYDEISKIIDRIAFLQHSYSDETIRRCRQHGSVVDGMQVPARFEDTSTNPVRSTKPSAELDVRTVDQSIIEMTNKFYALTEPVLRSILSNDLSAEFRFHLSREETRVIRHFRTASLILGRSGTGKTTCLLFKLVGKYLASKAVADERPARQVLLTRSPFLADKLSSYTRRLIKTHSPESANLEPPQVSQHTLTSTAVKDLEQSTVFDLRDSSFPLVCTWGSFLGMLDNTAAKYDSRRLYSLGEHTGQRSDEVTNTRPSTYGQLVDFHAFKCDYWPHFSHALTKDLPVHFVFAEIMGVIKGSASSRESLEPLRREDYLTRSCRLAPTFTLETERSRVYEVFQMYEKLKLESGGVDYVDRVVKLIRAVRGDSSLNQLLRFTFDEVYIDEIQDQRCLDIELLLSFVRDGRGFHFAGDTAQAISQDSTFRFADIKALFHEHFAAASAATHQVELSRPQMFTLSKNYRSHQGILALASLVMEMIWKGFPETVDKLEPEVGYFNGPKPVLFRGVEFDILCSEDASQTTSSAGATDFGAEQVILVRDARMKSILQDQIGDVALILTILESKGMEFDDVILWNFFTECPNQAGVRSLETLKNESGNFDPRRHGGMCSELKNFYVAITRARSQLFLMEKSESTATAVLKFLGNDGSGSLVHITSPAHEDFAMRLEMLRPGTSLDPQQWSRRGAEFMQRGMYKDARRYFRKAQDEDGETTAEGHELEKAARKCNAENDAEGFTQNLKLAVKCFLKVKRVNDATRVLVALGKSKDAAEILLENRQYSKAACLYAEAGLSTKAIDCHHLAKEYSEAAAIMNKERDYDRLVSYLDQNRGSIPTSVLHGYSLLVKLLLKQNKTSTECRKHAIKLLGSLAEQEKCFVDYRMDDELAELYTSQLRYKDLLHLYRKTGQLERALSLAITKDLLRSSDDGLESEVLNLLDYVRASHVHKGQQQDFKAPFELPSGFLTPKVILRVEQWEACSPIYSLEGSIAGLCVASLKGSVAKTILCLRNVLNGTTITAAKSLDNLPFEMIQEAIRFARELILDKDTKALNILLLLTGLWKPAGGKERFIVLPWSPLRESLAEVNNTDFVRFVTQRVLDGLVSAILALDTKARSLWREKWPIRCVQFITVGFCPRQRKGEPCNRVHRAVSEQDCSQVAEDSLRMNGIFCDLAVLYYRRAMNGSFQEKYLGIKRYWLEQLLRELIYLSAAEQHATTIRKTQAKLCYDQKYIAIFSSLEELLYFRLVREWSKRSNYTSLLEQSQLAKAFGPTLQNRFFRALSHRLVLDQRGLMQRHLGLLSSLKENVGRWNASFFQAQLTLVLLNLDNIDVPALSTFHSLAATIEYFAAHLILKTCTTACILPDSWIELHITSTNKMIHPPEPLQEDDKHRYQGCLVQLARSFCRILSRLEIAVLPTDFLICSGSPHPSLLLRQRNAELLAILVANLAVTSPEPPIGFNEVWARSKEVFDYEFIKAIHLRSHNPEELTQKLPPSFVKYNGKDTLAVVFRDRKKGSPFSRLEHQPGVRTVSFDQLWPPLTSPAPAENPTDQAPPSTSADGADVQYSAEETESIVRIQRLWRSVSVKIKARRAYVSTPVCRATARLFDLRAQVPDTLDSGHRKAILKLLLTHGVALSLRLDTAKGLLSRLQDDAMVCIEHVELSQGVDGTVDDILCRNRDVEALLEIAQDQISEEHLAGLLREGVLSVLEDTMKDVARILADADGITLQARRMLDAVSHN